MICRLESSGNIPHHPLRASNLTHRNMLAAIWQCSTIEQTMIGSQPSFWSSCPGGSLRNRLREIAACAHFGPSPSDRAGRARQNELPAIISRECRSLMLFRSNASDGYQISKPDCAGEDCRISFPAVVGVELMVVTDVQDEGRLAEKRCVDQAGTDGVNATLERPY